MTEKCFICTINLSTGKALSQPLGCMLPSDPEAHFGSSIVEMTYRNVADDKISPLGMRIGEELKFPEKMLELMEEGTELLYNLPAENEKTQDYRKALEL